MLRDSETQTNTNIISSKIRSCLSEVLGHQRNKNEIIRLISENVCGSYVINCREKPSFTENYIYLFRVNI